MQALNTGSRTSTESKQKVHYTTDRDPSSVSSSPFNTGAATPVEPPFALPQMLWFTDIDVGLSWRTDALQDSENGTFGVTLYPEFGRFRAWQDLAATTGNKQILSDKQSCSTHISINLDLPSLIGTMSPPPSNTLKANEPLDPKKERVWFTFLTLQR